MDRYTLSKSDRQTIFEIYRGCRLCGAGGGYRMPIIQNIVDLDDSKVELRQKIQECLQLEVRADDRMPPLICELCVDKVNDFYKFMQLVQQTNTRTRTRLGLPLLTARKGDKVESENTASILGDTEPKQEKPAVKKSKAGPKCSKVAQNSKKVKENEPEKVKEETALPLPVESRSSSVSSRSSKTSKPSTPSSSKPAVQPSRAQPKSTPKVTQQAPPAPQPKKSQPTKTIKVTQVTQEKHIAKDKKLKDIESKENEIKKGRHISRKELQNLLEDNASFEDNSLLVPRAQKRIREHEIPKPLIIPKRPKATPKDPVTEPIKEPTPPKPRPKSKQDPKPIPTPLKVPRKPKAAETPPPPKVEPPKAFNCVVCNMPLKTVQAVINHTKHHVPNYTKPQNACNPCGKWFPSVEEANTHHRYHRATTFPYHCRRCFEDYRTLPEYDLHITDNKCVPWETVPDVKCEDCWKTFPTHNLRKAHKCAGADARPGGKCSNCSKTYATLKSLKKHESTCNQRRKRDLIADPDVLRRLKPMQVRISRCDDILGGAGTCVDVSNLKPNYGLDRLYLYPYMKHKVKKSPKKPKPSEENYTHWDSDDSEDNTQIHRLSTLCIKKLFSKNVIGKVPKRRRKFKSIDPEFRMNCISKIINSVEAVAIKKKKFVDSLNDIIGVPMEMGEVANNENVENTDSEALCEEVLNQNCQNDANDNSYDKENSIDTNDCKEECTETGNDLNQNEDHNDAKDSSKESGSNDVDMQEINVDTKDCNEECTEKSEELNQNDVENDAEHISENTGNDKLVSNENIENTANDNSDSCEKGENLSQSVAENVKDTENDIFNNGNDVPSNCEPITSERSIILNHNESVTDIEEPGIDSSENNVNTDELNVNTALDEKREILNQTDCQVSDKDKCVETEDDNTDNHENDRNSVNNEDLNEKSNCNTDDDRVFKKEPVISEEKRNNENKSEIPLTENINDELVSDFSTNQQIETNSDHSNIENTNEEAIDEQESVNNVEENEHGKEETENLNNVESNSIGNDLVNLETHVTALIDNLNYSNFNGANNHEKETEQDGNESKNIEVTNKESPIKHSIENIIGDTDKNPERYIDEVISSLENIIKKNPRNDGEKVNGDMQGDIDDQNLLDALDEQIGEERKSDSDKITLEDLLPKEDRSMELDDISDDDFNFDT